MGNVEAVSGIGIHGEVEGKYLSVRSESDLVFAQERIPSTHRHHVLVSVQDAPHRPPEPIPRIPHNLSTAFASQRMRRGTHENKTNFRAATAAGMTRSMGRVAFPPNAPPTLFTLHVTRLYGIRIAFATDFCVNDKSYSNCQKEESFNEQKKSW